MAASSSQERNMSNVDVSDLATVENLKKLLVEYGSELLKPCDSTEELLSKLDNLEHVLFRTSQDHKTLVALALRSSKEALVANELIRHAEMDVRVSVASCITEIIRITAPDEPYEDEQMKEYFQLVNSAFGSLSCMSGRAYSKAVSILRTISYCESCVVMLDLQLHDIVRQMFHLFLDGIRTSHSNAIFSSMVNIMAVIIHNNIDNDELSVELAKILLDRLKKENQNVSPVSFKLAEDTLKNCSDDLKTYIPEAARSLGIPVEDYAEVVASLFLDATQRENMDSEDIRVDSSCHEETGLAVNDDLDNSSEGNNPENMKTDGNSSGKQITTPHLCEEPEKLGSPNQQEESKPDRPAGEPSSVPISREANRINRESVRRRGSSVKIALEEISRGKSIASEVLRRDINVKNHSEKRQASLTRAAPEKKCRGKSVISDSEDLPDEILNKELGSQSRPTSSKGEALSGKVSNYQNKRKSTTSKDEASKVRDASKCFGEEVVGCMIKVWWPLDEMFYEGKITAFDQVNKTHQVDYDDGDHEKLDLGNECWQLIGDDDLSTQKTVATLGASIEISSDRRMVEESLLIFQKRKHKEMWEQMMSSFFSFQADL